MDIMEPKLRDRFTSLWENYFPGSELPITIEFRDETDESLNVPQPDGSRCLICQINRARNGASLVFNTNSITCMGGHIFGGFPHEPNPLYRYFLSSGKPGEIEGERYKQTPDIVDAWRTHWPEFPPHGKNLWVKRWDNLTEEDKPEVVIFYARPEVLSGLFTLANYDQTDPYGVISPMGAGCSTIIQYPWTEQQKDNPKAVLGMFDPSARKCISLDILTMSFPMKRFKQIIGYMEESFLITRDWETVQKKMIKSAELYRKS